MAGLIRVAGAIDVVVDRVGAVFAWATFALMVVMAGNVVLRYLFATGTVWAQELEWHLMVPICLFGMVYALSHGDHVRVDILYANFGPRGRHAVDVFAALVGMVFGVAVIWLSQRYVGQSWTIGEGSANPGGIPHRYLLKALIPIGFALYVLQSFGHLCRHTAGFLALDPR